MDKYRQQVLELWSRWQALSLPRKMTWSIGAIGSLTLVGLLYWAAQPEYRVLYASMSAEETGAITAKLQSKGIPYKLAAGGATILVPADQVMQAYVDMANDGGAGSTKIGKGFDLFDQPMLSATPFNQHINFLRAQQAEVARTIMQIEPITFARVHIVLPEPSPFMRDQKPTTASVMVKLRTGATLSRNTVMAIAALVSGSVEGLPKESVRIVDANGRLLSVERDPDTGSVGSFMDMRKDVEQHLAKEAEHMLELALGTGKAIVRVTADLDNKSIKKREEKITGEGKVKSEKNVINKTTTTNSGKGGPAGTANNLTGKAPIVSGPTGVINTTENIQVDYDYPRTVIEWQNKNGSIERLTVAAFVDADSLKNSDPPITLEQVKETIKKAVGFKSERDEIQVTAVKMPSAVVPEAVEEDPAANTRLQTMLTIVRYVSIGAIALCVLPIFWMLFRRRAAAAKASAAPMQRLADELDRNPQALAKILAHWMDQSEGSTKKAA